VGGVGWVGWVWGEHTKPFARAHVPRGRYRQSSFCLTFSVPLFPPCLRTRVSPKGAHFGQAWAWANPTKPPLANGSTPPCGPLSAHTHDVGWWALRSVAFLCSLLYFSAPPEGGNCSRHEATLVFRCGPSQVARGCEARARGRRSQPRGAVDQPGRGPGQRGGAVSLGPLARARPVRGAGPVSLSRAHTFLPPQSLVPTSGWVQCFFLKSKALVWQLGYNLISSAFQCASFKLAPFEWLPGTARPEPSHGAVCSSRGTRPRQSEVPP
jgi:hypothetical protein